MNWATSSCTNWDKCPAPSSAIRASSTCRRDSHSVHVECVFDLVKPQLEGSPQDSKHLIIPYYFARINRSRGKKYGETQWQQDHWKAVDAKRGAKKQNKATITIRWQQDESTEILSSPIDGQKNVADTWTTSRRSTSLTSQTGSTGPVREPVTLACNEEDRQAGLVKRKKRFQTHYASSRKSSTRTKTTEFLPSED